MAIVIRLIIATVTLAVSVDFFFLDLANVWIKIGFFIFVNASSGLKLALLTRVPAPINTITVFRVWSIAYLIAGCFGIIGSLVLGGGLGWLGVFISFGIAWVGGLMFFQIRTFGTPAVENPSE